LKVDAATRVDLSYPRVSSRPLVAAKLPIEGKVKAHELDVAWVAQFTDRVQTLGGRVNIDAKLAGTAGDPQFIGDVRWKDGNVVTTAPPKGTAPQQRSPQAPAARPSSSGGAAPAR
jgi:autotransporter translocation and assembly factor TamB